MRVSVVAAEWSPAPDKPGWVLRFSGGPFHGVPLSPAPEWGHADGNLHEDDVRDMIQATASWEGISLASDFTVDIRR